MLAPSVNGVNSENCLRLAAFIESEQHPWGYSKCMCFVGNLGAILGDQEISPTEVGGFLGIGMGAADRLCLVWMNGTVWGSVNGGGCTDGILPRAHAVAILRHLAATGEVVPYDQIAVPVRIPEMA